MYLVNLLWVSVGYFIGTGNGNMSSIFSDVIQFFGALIV